MPGRSIVERVIAGFGGKLTTLLTSLLAATLIIYSGYVLYDTFYIQKNAGNSWDLLDLRPQIVEDINDGSSPLSGSLAQINEDYRAWLTIYDTNIDYPVMQGPNNLYYASHDIYRNSSLTGCIYLASENSSDLSDNYNLIYGHHMDNDLLFGGLDGFTEKDFFDSHREGVLIASDSIYDLEIFASMLTDAYEDMVYIAGSRDLTELMTFISDNAVQWNADAAAGAVKIAAFSTCAAAETNGRLVVFAKMVKRGQEDPSDGDPAVPGTPGGDNTPGNPDGGTPVAPEGGAPDGRPAAPAIPEAPDVNEPDIAEGSMGEADSAEVITIDDEETPLANVVNRFKPTGGSYGDRAWALVNLVCVILTIYLLIPLTRIKGKVNRVKTMLKLNDLEKKTADAAVKSGDSTENDRKWINRFRTRLIIGFALEILIAAAAVIVFILTENMRLPMVLIDKWTPIMLIILLVCWGADLLLVRSHRKQEEPA